MHELSCCLITSFEGAQKVKWVGCRKGAGEQYKMLWIINHCSVLVWVSFVKCFQAGMFVSCWGVQTRVTIPWQKETTLPSIMHMFIPLCICIYIYSTYMVIIQRLDVEWTFFFGWDFGFPDCSSFVRHTWPKQGLQQTQVQLTHYRTLKLDCLTLSHLKHMYPSR